MMKMTTLQKTIDIPKDFSTEPYGRYLDDGDSNGTVFREEFVIPALAQYKNIIISLDGAEGYGSSFLEEAFGGLVREHGLTPRELRERLTIVSVEDPTLIAEIWEYIETAIPKTRG